MNRSEIVMEFKLWAIIIAAVVVIGVIFSVKAKQAKGVDVTAEIPESTVEKIEDSKIGQMHSQIGDLMDSDKH